MNEQKQKENKAYINRYDTVIAFLSLELIALTLFGLGGATGLSILKIVSVFVAILAFPFIRNNYQGDFKKEALLSLIPLGVILALLAFGPFGLAPIMVAKPFPSSSTAACFFLAD